MALNITTWFNAPVQGNYVPTPFEVCQHIPSIVTYQHSGVVVTEDSGVITTELLLCKTNALYELLLWSEGLKTYPKLSTEFITHPPHSSAGILCEEGRR